MSSIWPQEVVNSIAEKQAILFLGSGVSAGCMSSSGKRMPTWNNLLTELLELVNSKDLQTEAKNYLDNGNLLTAAEIIEKNVLRYDLNTKISSSFADNTISPGEVHEIINQLDTKIVLTTNYDRLYERYWESIADKKNLPLTTIYHTDQKPINKLRESSRSIIKIHGCVNDVENIVLTRSSYNKAKYKYSRFFKIVSALMLTRPVLFLGCGFSGDPDIDLLLEEIADIGNYGHPNYALVPEGKSQTEKDILERVYNIKLIEYENPSGNHENFATMLKDLLDEVEAIREIS